MRIVVLDGYTLNPGDLDWRPLQERGAEVTVHERTAPEALLNRAAGAEVLLTNKCVLDGDTIRQLDALRYIGVLATGYNVVDVDAARERGVVVTNIPGYSTESVAQLVFALVLGLARRVELHAGLVRDGGWSGCADFSFQRTPQLELSGRTLGIAGYGAIGRAVARIGQAFGMQVLVHTRTEPGDLPAGVRLADRPSLLAESDVLSLHCPLTPETKGFIGPAALERMKPTAFLINTARGPLVDESALARALEEGAIAGAGLDVMEQEPPPPDSPLFKAPNCLITPHLAWATLAARHRLLETAAANLRAWANNAPVNQVPGSA